jgi:hypothetical protein
MSAQTTKLRFLLRSLWQSPLFGDSFPPMDEQAFLLQFQSMVPAFVEKLVPVLRVGLPDATDEEIDDLVGQLTPKSLAFCAGIAAGEIEDTERLLQAALIMALVYWVDQSMDRGDEMMLLAVQRMEHSGSFDLPVPALSRWNVLQHMQALIRQVVQDPQDTPYAMQAILEVLKAEARMREFSKNLQGSQHPEKFWQIYSQDVVKNSILSGLMTVTTLIYSLYHQSYPSLPSLSEALSCPILTRLIDTTLNAAVRVFDDAGDWKIDAGLHREWGIFTINLFNQANETFYAQFLESSGLKPEDQFYRQTEDAFHQPLATRRVAVVKIYVELVRHQVVSIPESVYKKYEIFLTVLRRVMEAALVTMAGDIFLAETSLFEAIDSEISHFILPNG